jgi:hypothetical protein
MRVGFLLSLMVALSADGDIRPLEFKTAVEPLPNENLIGPCSFESSIPGPTPHVRAVWITYDRADCEDLSKTVLFEYLYSMPYISLRAGADRS